MSNSLNLSEEAKEIMRMRNEEHLTYQEIAHRRGKNIRGVKKIAKKLIIKGLIRSIKVGGVHQREGHHVRGGSKTPVSGNKYRLHNEHYCIRVLVKSGLFYRCVGCQFRLDGNLVRVHNDSIEVHSSHFFVGSSVEEVEALGAKYWAEFWVKLELHLNISFWKEGSKTVRRVNHHVAEVNSDVAEYVDAYGGKLRVKGEDGKTWLLVDNSFNLNELECVHPKRASEDMGVMKAFLDDVRRNPILLSEFLFLVKEQAVNVNELAKGLRVVVEWLKPKEEVRPDAAQRRVPDYIQ